MLTRRELKMCLIAGLLLVPLTARAPAADEEKENPIYTYAKARVKEFHARRAAGLTVERLSGAEARAMEPALSPEVRGALWFPHDAQVHPPSSALADRTETRG